MRIVFKGCLFVTAALVADVALALTCTKCNGVVLPTDTFCTKCGADVVVPPLELSSPPPQSMSAPQSYTYRSNEQVWSPSSADLPFYQGMGRGLVTTCGSPLECVRLVGVSFVEVLDWDKRNSRSSSFNAGDLGPLGAVLAGGIVVGAAAVGVVAGGISAVGDVCVGTLDFLTFGTVGDAVWKDQKKHPYFWGRRWGRGDVGGAIF